MTTDSTTSAATSGAPSRERDADRTRSYADWQRAVAGVLAKARRVDVSELPAQPETLLETTTYDGVTVAPLYTRADELGEPPLPGAFPFVRGRDAQRDVNVGWLVAQQFGHGERSAAAVNESILSALESGVSALRLSVGAGAVATSALADALAGVLLDLAPVTIDAGAEARAAAEALFALLDTREIAERESVRVGLGAGPLTDEFGARPGIGLAETVQLAQRATERTEQIRAITVDGTVFHDRGAADAQELGAAIAAGVAYVRALTAAGLSPQQALGQIEFRFAATDDQFETIAKFRAARTLWARVAQVCGAAESGAAPQHAVTSSAMMTQRDPWVNMLRTTLAAFGAGVGGADSVTVLPFDAALPADARTVSKSFSERMARNTQLLLLEESHLGRVLDPGAGSWFIESLTEQLGQTAWAFFQQIEASGGYDEALRSGLIAEAIARTHEQRAADIAHRRTAVTGVNEFPNLGEAALAGTGSVSSAGSHVVRYAADFEALRDRSDDHLAATGARPRALLATLGSVAEHNARSTFAANLLASGGIDSVNPGPLDVAGIADAVAAAGKPAVAVICGSDKQYGALGTEAVAALRAAGVTHVVLAGPEKALAGATTDLPDGFVTARIDAVATLSGLLDILGVK
ncbi:methylmalonyl-CoA mutase small subunit [Speluncibacter jeojiensis]|uniref:Methylmalonyl-CoA mutase small subunit n=1 Tax=Speluncibacter jeojiensis TaxID=2710754 RepID=A0A9X4M2S3_9ACTN|nr:methylmalonyl-CoA mutase small subunit [Corynebacteriales bacterium D3-21]